MRASSTGMKVTSQTPLAAEFWISPEARYSTNCGSAAILFASAVPRSMVTPESLPVAASLTE